MKVISGSMISMGVNNSSTEGNLLNENGETASSRAEGAELYHCKYSQPDIINRYNDFVDTRSGNNDKLIYTTAYTNKLDGTNNYFEGNSSLDKKNWSYPFDYVIGSDDWSTSRNRTDDLSYFAQAEIEENLGNFSNAAALYYLSFTIEENLTAFSFWIRSRISNNENIEDILQDVTGYLDDELLGSLAFWKQINLQNILGEYETSILQLDDFISNATSDEDEILGLLAQLDAYYLMALAMGTAPGKNFNSPTINRDDPFYISQVGVYEESVPYSINDYHAKCALLNRKMTASGGETELTDNSLPQSFELEKAYPNPFNPATTIGFKLPEASEVKMTVFDVLGREVATILNSEVTAGSHTAIWNGKDASGQMVASGIYFVTMNAESFTASQKLILLK